MLALEKFSCIVNELNLSQIQNIYFFNICAKPFRYFSLPLILALGKPQWGDEAGQVWSLCVFIQRAQSWKNHSAEDARAGTPRRWAPWDTGQVSSPTGAFPTSYECAEAFLTTLPFGIPFQGKLRRAQYLWGGSPALSCCWPPVFAASRIWGAAVFGRVLHVAATPCLGGASPGWFCLCTVRVPQRELCHLCEDLELNRTTPLQG